MSVAYTNEFWKDWSSVAKSLVDTYGDLTSGHDIPPSESKGLFVLNTSANSATLKLHNGAEFPLAGYAGIDFPFPGVTLSGKNTTGGSTATLLMIYRK